MSATEKSFTMLDGVPVHYDRRSVSDYGTKGVAANWHCTNTFYKKLIYKLVLSFIILNSIVCIFFPSNKLPFLK